MARGDRPEFMLVYERGMEAMDEGRYEDALAAFRQSMVSLPPQSA